MQLHYDLIFGKFCKILGKQVSASFTECQRLTEIRLYFIYLILYFVYTFYIQFLYDFYVYEHKHWELFIEV